MQFQTLEFGQAVHVWGGGRWQRGRVQGWNEYQDGGHAKDYAVLVAGRLVTVPADLIAEAGRHEAIRWRCRRCKAEGGRGEWPTRFGMSECGTCLNSGFVGLLDACDFAPPDLATT